MLQNNKLLNNISEVELNKIKVKWPLSYGRCYDSLMNSIEQISLTTPLVLFPESDNNYTLISGGLRFKAMEKLQYFSTPAFILKSDLKALELFKLSLAFNQLRGFNPAELVILYSYSVQEFGEQPAINNILGLDKSSSIRERCLAASRAIDECLDMLLENNLDLENAALISNWVEEDQKNILQLFKLLNPSRQGRRQWLEWLSDLSRINKVSITKFLMNENFFEYADLIDKHGRPAVENMARKKLWSLRHPLTAELLTTRKELLKSLTLPKNLKFDLNDNFEDINFNLNLTFKNLQDFEILFNSLKKLNSSETFKKLMEDN